MKFRDYYAVLGVARDASAEQIKRAWRKLARKYHPDVSKEADAQLRMQEVNEAYEVLSDAEKRAAYDRLGSDYRAGQDFTPPPDWERAFGGGFGRGAAGDGQAAEDLGELFEHLFGRSAGARRRPARGHDEHARIEIDLDDSLRGATRELRLQTAEPADDGRLHLRERVLQVNIPRGVRPGQQLRLAGQGAAGANGARGDLYLEVAFRPHRLYRVDGADLYLTLPLAPWEAALGAGVRVPTPEGPVDLQVPPDTATGRKLRLKGRGIPSRPPGDLYAVAEVVLPPAESDRAREAYRAMARDLAFEPRRGWPV